MARSLKYPELLDLNIGQSLFVPLVEVGNMQVLRNIVFRLGKKHNLAFEVHLDRKNAEVEIARVTRQKPIFDRVMKQTSGRGQWSGLSKEEKLALLEEAQRKLDVIPSGE